jgi:type II secretory pathway predicted ATPase ExeA
MKPDDVFSIEPIPSQTEALGLFKGRYSERHALTQVVKHRSEHALIVGEIAVGKTSLGNILGPTLAGEGAPVDVRRTSCDSGTTFASLWDALLPTARRWPEDSRQADIVRHLNKDTRLSRVLLIDELEALRPEPLHTLAELVRRVSDERLSVTFILIGASKVQEALFKAHRSLSTFVKVLHVYRMPLCDLESIVAEGFKKLQIACSDGHVRTLALLSMGLPRAVHKLALECAESARRDSPNATMIRPSHVDRAIQSFAQASPDLKKFRRQSQQVHDVLVACAMTTPDADGTFRAGDIARALSELTGEPKRTSDFYEDYLSLLSRLSIVEDERLNREIRFRFRIPWYQPVILTQALSQQVLKLETFRRCHNFKTSVDAIWSEISECCFRSVEAFDSHNFELSEAYYDRAVACEKFVDGLQEESDSPGDDPINSRIRENLRQLQTNRKGPVD